MSRRTAMIFDLGNTLIHTDRVEPFRQRLAELEVRQEAQQVQDAFDYCDRYYMKNYPGELGREPSAFYLRYLDLLLAYLHILEVDKQALYRNLFEKSPPRSVWVPYGETKPFLAELRRRGVKIGLLTNWDLGARELLRRLGLYDCFDSVVVSSEIQAEKPEKTGFLRIMEQLGVSPREALYVGDNYYDDVQGANSVGMPAALLNRSNFESPRLEGDYILIHSLAELLELTAES